MIRPLDYAVRWTKRHRGITLGAILILAILAFIHATVDARNAARDARATSKAAKQQSAAAKITSAANRKLIETLIANGERHRTNLDNSRYQAAIRACRRQNVGRMQGNELAEIVKTALSTLKPKSSEIAAKLIALGKKVKYTPLTDCVAVVPNPAQLDPTHKPPKVPKNPDAPIHPAVTTDEPAANQ